MDEEQLKEKYLTQKGFRKAKGFAINTEEMNPDGFEEVYFEGETLQEAIKYYYRTLEEYWIYKPSDGEQVFDVIDDALDYAEEVSDVSFEDFKKSEAQPADSKES